MGKTVPVEHADPDLDPSRPKPPSWREYTEWLLPQWTALLDSDPEERAVQEFLEQHPSLLPGATGDIGPGGHHGPTLGGVWAEPELAGLDRDRVPDFMWVTRSTSLITPICIEIERPGKHWFRLDGAPTAELTQALDQLTDWKVWFSEPENQLVFRRQYMVDAFTDRPIRPQYVLLYGRRAEFETTERHANPGRLAKKRDYMARVDEYFMTFDSLRPNEKSSDELTLRLTAGGPRVHAVPPTFTTGPRTAEDARILGDLGPALARTPLISEERREHIAARWRHWQQEAGRAQLRRLGGGE